MPAMPRAARRIAAVLLLLAAVVAGCDSAAPQSGADTPSGSPSAPAAGGGASSTPSVAPSVLIAPASASPSPHSSLIGGGPLAALVVERMARTPFSARLEIKTTSLTKTDTATADLTGTETGAINGTDIDLAIDAISGGVHLQQRLIVVGDQAYAKQSEGPWQVGPRATVDFTLQQLFKQMRYTPNAEQLADVGEETVDGQIVHHLTLVAPFTVEDPLNGTVRFDVYDLWALPDGSPVLRRIGGGSTKGSLTATSESETHYRDFGTVIAIEPPELPATPAPSRRG